MLQKIILCAFLIGQFLSSTHLSSENVEHQPLEGATTTTTSTLSPPYTTGASTAATNKDNVRQFLNEIFLKYGKKDVMTLDGFEHLLVSLGLGTAKIDDHDVHDHYTNDGFSDIHPDHEHNSSNLDATINSQPSSTLPATPAKLRAAGDDHQRHKRNSEGRSMDSSSNELQKRSAVHNNLLNKEAKKCMSAAEFMGMVRVRLKLEIDQSAFVAVCPAIIYQLDEHVCHRHDACHAQHADKDWHCGQYHPDRRDGARSLIGKNTTEESPAIYGVSSKIWGMAFAAVVVISLCGLCGVAIIPIIDKFFYNQLLQFLIALAVGTLTGDALLHLLPHAMAPHHEENEYSLDNGDSKQSVWAGLSALGGLFGFFLVEQFISLHGKMKRQRDTTRIKAVPSVELGMSSSRDGNRSHDHCDVTPVGSKENYLEQRRPLNCDSSVVAELEDETNHNQPFHNEGHTHGHDRGHGHGHGHSVPTTMSSAALMVIMGDGLHNFTDGLAIGASFASSLAVGLSTSLAVFCHELPHELGDFAVLLKSGMSVRQALVYNIISSVLCLIGMIIGVLVGHVESATSWIFTVTAGIFIYIALVDMLPEMTSTLAHAGDSSGRKQLQYLLLHASGIAVGVGVMLLIALYEENIQFSIDGNT